MDENFHDVDGVWDELNHEVTREIRIHREKTSSRNQSVTARIGEAMQQTAAALSSFATDKRARLHDTYSRNLCSSEAPTTSTAGSFTSSYVQQSSASNASNSTDSISNGNLAEFGIDVPQDTSFENSQSHPLETNALHRPIHVQSSRDSTLDRFWEDSRRHLRKDNAANHTCERDPSKNFDFSGPASVPLLSDNISNAERSNAETGGGRRHQTDFVLLGSFRRQPLKEGWGAVADLDTFFGSVYSYYYHRGLTHIVGKGVVELISLFFTLALSVFLFAYLDWSELVKCKDEESCHDTAQTYIRPEPFSKTSAWNFLVFLYCVLFTCYGTFSMFRFYSNVKNALVTRSFYLEKLGISARQLEGGAIEWDDIVQKIIKLQDSGEYRVAIHGEQIDELIIAQRVMRKENFMVCFINRNMLDLRLPVPWPLSDDGYSKFHYLCTSVEWSIHVCIFNFMFNHKHGIRPAFCMEPSALKRRFVLCGIAHAVFMPFLLFFMTLHFFLVNMYVWRSSKQYLGPRDWSLIAKWKFREFNELPHAFERRLGPSYQTGDDYLKLFTQSAVVSYIGRVIVFISGSLVAVLLGLAALNDAILLHVKYSHWNLLWYVGILGVAFSVGKGMLPDEKIHPPYAHNLFAEMDASLAKVAMHTHYYPEIWKKRGWKKETQKQFSALFRYKSQLFVSEVIATLLAPFVLCVSLPKCADSLCSFVHKAKTEIPGSGDMCGYACFDFDAFGDENWEGRKMGARDGMRSAGDQDGRPKTVEGKMEKSFFSFKTSHPNWKCNPSGQNLIQRIQRYKQLEALALAKERQLYIDAATRQFKAFYTADDRKEQRAEEYKKNVNTIEIDETYVSNGAKTTERGNVVDVEQVKNLKSPYHSKREIEDRLGFGAGLDNSCASVTVRRRRTPSDAGIDDEHEENTDSQITPKEGYSNDQGQGVYTVNRTAVSSPQCATPQYQRQDVASSLSPQEAAAAFSVMHYADLRLSAELQKLLNRSMFDAGASIAGITLGETLDPAQASQLRLSRFSVPQLRDTMTIPERVEDQYMCLERYHSHLIESGNAEENDSGSVRSVVIADAQGKTDVVDAESVQKLVA